MAGGEGLGSMDNDRGYTAAFQRERAAMRSRDAADIARHSRGVAAGVGGAAAGGAEGGGAVGSRIASASSSRPAQAFR